MKPIFRTTAIAVLMALMSATAVFAQNTTGMAPDKNRDYVVLQFSNMGDLPTNGTVCVTWTHTDKTTHWDFEYAGSKRYDSGIATSYDWVQIKVTVTLYVSPMVWYSATKYWDGVSDTFYFTGSDFKPNLNGGGGTNPN